MPIPLPTFLVGPLISWARDRHQSRRKVKLTVHRAFLAEGPFFASGGGPIIGADAEEQLFVTVTNASHDRDIVVTHVWFDTTPPVHIHDQALPVRLQHSAPWETHVPKAKLPAGTTDVEWLARCQITPDDKVIRSRPRRNVPPFGTIPRG